MHQNTSPTRLRILQVFYESPETQFYTETVEDNSCGKVNAEDGWRTKEQRGRRKDTAYYFEESNV